MNSKLLSEQLHEVYMRLWIDHITCDVGDAATIWKAVEALRIAEYQNTSPPTTLSPDGTQIGFWKPLIEGAASDEAATGYDAGYADGYLDGATKPQDAQP